MVTRGEVLLFRKVQIRKTDIFFIGFKTKIKIQLQNSVSKMSFDFAKNEF
jgi:hypothetical protein